LILLPQFLYGRKPSEALSGTLRAFVNYSKNYSEENFLMTTSSEQPTLPEARKRKWVRPLITVIVLIGLLILLTDGEVLEPFIYSNF